LEFTDAQFGRIVKRSGFNPDYKNRAHFNFQEMYIMTAVKKLTGIALAAAAAGMFVTAGISSAFADEAKVHCQGVNACKGKSDCKSASNACKGQNACKGEGWKAMTDKECKDAGGTTK